MRNPHLAIMLAAAGLTFAAEVLERADSASAEMEAIKLALAGIEGYRLALRRHERALQHTSASFESGQLRGLEGDLKKRLSELLAREEGSDAAAE